MGSRSTKREGNLDVPSMQRLFTQIGRSQRLCVVHLLKREGGLSVRELAKRLDMSYMGVKQHCIELERDHYVDTTRRNRGVGRPELIYRLTGRAHDLFPKADNALGISFLAQAKKLFGAGAPQKMLYLHFQQLAAGYREQVGDGSPRERARKFAKVRDREGFMATYLAEPTPRIIERHHPMQELLDVHPEAAALEIEMIQHVLGGPVSREVSADPYQCVYIIA